jgi:mannitol-1-/sugar-/sorbitol-6-/2-deoxyglucose-6-phosphatase
MVDTVIFDMDGLLINSEPLWGEAMEEVFAAIGVTITPELAQRTTGLRTNEVVDYWQRYFGWQGYSNEVIINDILDSVIRKILAAATLQPGANEVLEAFRSRGIKMGLASSSPVRVIETALNHFSLTSYFKAVHSAEHEVYGKPHPAVYIACAEKLGTPSIHCLAFEDSINGMVAAKAARMKAVVVPEAHNRNNPKYALADLRLESLEEFGEEHWAELSSW